MLEILRFIFSDIWVWIGFTITSIGLVASLRGGALIKIKNKGKKNGKDI